MNLPPAVPPGRDLDPSSRIEYGGNRSVDPPVRANVCPGDRPSGLQRRVRRRWVRLRRRHDTASTTGDAGSGVGGATTVSGPASWITGGGDSEATGVAAAEPTLPSADHPLTVITSTNVAPTTAGTVKIEWFLGSSVPQLKHTAESASTLALHRWHRMEWPPERRWRSSASMKRQCGQELAAVETDWEHCGHFTIGIAVLEATETRFTPSG